MSQLFPDKPNGDASSPILFAKSESIVASKRSNKGDGPDFARFAGGRGPAKQPVKQPAALGLTGPGACRGGTIRPFLFSEARRSSLEMSSESGSASADVAFPAGAIKLRRMHRFGAACQNVPGGPHRMRNAAAAAAAGFPRVPGLPRRAGPDGPPLPPEADDARTVRAVTASSPRAPAFE